jgi:hypothetical protein
MRKRISERSVYTATRTPLTKDMIVGDARDSYSVELKAGALATLPQ